MRVGWGQIIQRSKCYFYSLPSGFLPELFLLEVWAPKKVNDTGMEPGEEVFPWWVPKSWALECGPQRRLEGDVLRFDPFV